MVQVQFKLISCWPSAQVLCFIEVMNRGKSERQSIAFADISQSVSRVPTSTGESQAGFSSLSFFLHSSKSALLVLFFRLRLFYP